MIEYYPVYIQTANRKDGLNDENKHFLCEPSGLVISVVPGENGKGMERFADHISALRRDQKEVVFKDEDPVNLSFINELTKPVKKKAAKKKVTKKKTRRKKDV
jgi:hypothetical protein